jgi:hypothetical protein
MLYMGPENQQGSYFYSAAVYLIHIGYTLETGLLTKLDRLYLCRGWLK